MPDDRQIAHQGFQGFPPEAFEFFTGLEANNDRAWFAEHKATYERAVKWPAEAYVGEMEDALGELLGAPVRSKVFRIHRDIRFSKDKRPYNTHLHVAFFEREPQGPAGSGFYMGLEARRFILGGGSFDFPGPLLVAFREAVADARTGGEIQALVDGLAVDGWRLHGEPLRRVPPGYPADHPRSELIRHKGLAMFRDMAPEVASGPAVIAESLAAFARFAPVHAWLGALRAKA